MDLTCVHRIPFSIYQEGGGGKGSSRRKPKVTHKVVDTDDDAGPSGDDENEETPFQTYNDANGVNGQEGETKEIEKEEKGKSKSQGGDAIDVDEEGNPILPEGNVDSCLQGSTLKDCTSVCVVFLLQISTFSVRPGTVMVEPEAVDERRPRFQGPEFRKRRRCKLSLRLSSGRYVCVSILLSSLFG